MYFKLTLKKNYKTKTKKKITIIYNTNHKTTLIIQQQLKKILNPNIQITHFSKKKTKKKKLNQYFTIFTTIPLKNIQPQTPIIHLTNLFNNT